MSTNPVIQQLFSVVTLVSIYINNIPTHNETPIFKIENLINLREYFQHLTFSLLFREIII